MHSVKQVSAQAEDYPRLMMSVDGAMVVMMQGGSDSVVTGTVVQVDDGHGYALGQYASFDAREFVDLRPGSIVTLTA